MSIQMCMRKKKIESNFIFDFLSQRFQTSNQSLQHADSESDSEQHQCRRPQLTS